MKISIKSAGPCRQIIKVEVPTECVAAERAELLKYYAKGVALPGFRRGHAPKELVEKKLAKELAADLKDRVVPKFYHEAIEKEKTKVVAIVNVSEPELIEGQPLKFEVTVDVPPEFKLPPYGQISIQPEKTDVSQAQVDELVQTILRQHATYEEVADRVAQENDRVQISYESTVEGQPLEEKIPQAHGLGKGNGYWITCDDEAFLPGLGLALIGSKIGDKKEVSIHFPESFIVKELAGVQALFQVELTGMRATKLPDINAEFLKSFHMESESEWRENIRRHLEDVAQHKEKNRQQDAVCDFLLEKTKLDVPESVVKEQTRIFAHEIARQRIIRGLSREQMTAQRDDLMKEAEKRAITQVKLRYILAALADAEQIQVTDQELADEIVRMAVQQRRDAADYRKELEEEEQMALVREQIRSRKTIELLLEKAKSNPGRPWWSLFRK